MKKINSQALLNDPDFKEDSVREVIILPLLKKLGYGDETILRSKTLQHPFLKTGTTKRKVKLVPDYCLKVGDSFAWVLDAKAPQVDLNNTDHVEQVYSYATHPEIKSVFFALCNGVKFVLYETGGDGTPRLQFSMDQLEHYWQTLGRLLAPTSFKAGRETTSVSAVQAGANRKFDYKTRPLLKEIPVRKRAAKRHFGVHGYFTKQAWNVVAEHIKHFSREGDLVLDPFGGSGVTAIEALMNDRRAINVDLNPMAIFLVEALVAPVPETALAAAFERVKSAYRKQEPQSEAEVAAALEKYPRSRPLPLPKGSDVATADQLFSPKQTAQLGLLKKLILKEKEKNVRQSLLLMFSGLITKVNLTFHTTKAEKKDGIGGGDSAPFRYYRYRLAPKPREIDAMKYFELRYKKVLAAKREMATKINSATLPQLQLRQDTATDLSFLENESVDYIYTDPPYGKKIPYLDLSAMWNAWLDLEVTETDREQEAIEGGERNKTKASYNALIAQSIKEMYRVLKFDRWLSFVFAHKDPEFWHLITQTAEACGFEYIGAVPQKNGQTSFKKRQHPFTVLSGQLIIHFKKTETPRRLMRARLGMNITEAILQTTEGIIAKNDGATLEEINDELTIRGMELGFLHLLKKEYDDLTPFLLENFAYDPATEKYSIKEKGKFKTNLPVELRIKYYLLSYLKRMELQSTPARFDEIIQELIPLLKNGTTPEEQTILGVLREIAEEDGEDSWRLRKEGHFF